MPNVLIVNSIGPQGPVGPQGPTGPSGSVSTGSFVTTSSFNAFTGSYNTGSFTGSFIGNGVGLYNIPASGITGLNLSQIASGSYSASISPTLGFTVNTNANISGALTASSAIISGNVTVQGTASINTLVVNQTVLSTGSNQLGDAVNDTQTLYGSVIIPTGSLTVTGSTFISSSNSTQLQVGNSALFVSSSGQVGIGTTTPTNLLTLNTNINATDGIFITNSNTGNLARSLIRLINDTGNVGQLSIWGSGNALANKTFFEATKDFVVGVDAGTPSGGTSKFQIYVNGYNFATSPQFTMFSTGNVSIGSTTDAGYKLNVSGSGRFTSDVQITGSLTVQTLGNTTQITSVVQAGTGSLALVPQGVGAITAQIPDGTTAGGNARGQYAVDFSMGRGAAGYGIASGNYSVAFGYGSLASGAYSIVMGNQNSATAQGSTSIGGGLGAGQGVNATANFATAIGGVQNNAQGQYSGVFSGFVNTASSNYSTVLGGQSNTASTNTHATVVGGYSNTASGQYSIAGGASNTSSGQGGVALGWLNSNSGFQGSVAIGYQNTNTGNTGAVAIGYNNNVSGFGSFALGASNTVTNSYSNAVGHENKSSISYTLSIGYRSSAYLYAQNTLASGYFTTQGDAQQSLLTARVSSSFTTAQTASLSLDGTGVTNLITPSGPNRTWNTTVNWVATVTGSSGTTTGVTVGDSIYGVSEFGFKVSASIASITPLIRDSIVADTTIMETATLTYATGSSNSLAMTFTAPTFAGGGSLGMRVVAKVSLVELGW